MTADVRLVIIKIFTFLENYTDWQHRGVCNKEKCVMAGLAGPGYTYTTKYHTQYGIWHKTERATLVTDYKRSDFDINLFHPPDNRSRTNPRNFEWKKVISKLA